MTTEKRIRSLIIARGVRNAYRAASEVQSEFNSIEVRVFVGDLEPRDDLGFVPLPSVRFVIVRDDDPDSELEVDTTMSLTAEGMRNLVLSRLKHSRIDQESSVPMARNSRIG
ncbi:hypothetical protein SAMN05444166_0140 [Singulisphaera sp. GP187]|uniref:hypothetical protein n=1 Tax=Singulisphaera sp. GP187 TaxID=1882752 RepID=UPI0009298883|nr:hypothetical protein [Singulisphaera sp. GP187]SIN68999.1 hypothetical protein SAMN05444166_0140 [Singulisphaera sp. GP187]